jgi:hypothetical protein
MSALMQAGACVSDLALDQRLSAELSAAEADALDAHLVTCVRCRMRHELMERQRAEFLAQTPSWQQFDAQQRAPRRSRLPRIGAFGALAAAAAVLLFVQTNDGSLLDSRTKGAPSLGFYIKRGSQVIRGASGEIVHPGDVLRFTYTTERPRYFALLNTDSSTATIYHPLTPTPALIEPGRDAALGFGIELDAQLGTERVFAVFCDAPLALEPVRLQLEVEGALPTLPNCSTDMLVLDKRSR